VGKPRRKSRRLTRKERKTIVELVRYESLTIPEVALRLQLSPHVVEGVLRELNLHHGSPAGLVRADLERLRAENAKLEEENEILRRFGDFAEAAKPASSDTPTDD
jgi:transposase-like protein